MLSNISIVTLQPSVTYRTVYCSRLPLLDCSIHNIIKICVAKIPKNLKHKGRGGVWAGGLPPKEAVMPYKYERFIPYDLLDNVNFWVNKNIRYERDRVPYAQSPEESLKLGTGDCEDYAYLKAFKLIEAGADPKTLQIAVVTDRIDKSVYHAVLLASTRVKKGFFWNRKEKDVVLVLDNRWNALYTFTETSYVLKSVHRVPKFCITGSKK